MSKLAQAGESRTASPGRAACAASTTASSMEAAPTIGTPPPPTPASISGASPPPSPLPPRQERVCALREPGLAATLEQTPVLRAPWDIEAEGDRLSARQRHCEAARIIAVEHLDAVARKDPRFGASVVVDAAVAVQMVFADVEDRSRVRSERGGRLELEAGELQHPQARGLSLVFTAHNAFQHRRPDVAADF